MENKVSIIVPIYNTAKYLCAAIESVICQTYQNWELLLIDDGSTDGCAEICDGYAAEDPRVRVTHTENWGVSHARNLGLEQATGEWLCFLDSDDELEERAIEILLSNADGADVVMGNFRFNQDKNENIKERWSVDISHITDQEVSTLFDCDFFFTVWGKLYKNESIRCQFPEDLSYGEDTCYNLNCFWNWNRIVLLPDCVIMHYGRYGSLSNSNYLDMPQRLRIVLEQFRSTFTEYPELKQRAFKQYTEGLRHYFWFHIHNRLMSESAKRMILSVWLTDDSIDADEAAIKKLSPQLVEFWKMVLNKDAESIYCLLK